MPLPGKWGTHPGPVAAPPSGATAPESRVSAHGGTCQPPPRPLDCTPVLKKTVLTLVLLVVLCAAGFYLAGGWLLGAATRAALPRLVDLAQTTGLRVARCEFATASVHPLVALHWKNWDIAVARPVTPRTNQAAAETLGLRLAQVRLTITGWAPLTADLAVDGGTLETPFYPAAPADLPFAGDEFGVAIERIDSGFLHLPGLALATDPRPLLAALAKDLEQLARGGRTARELQLGARLHFQLKGEPLTVRLETERRAGATWLRFNAADIAELSRRSNQPLTAAEQQLLCAHPQRALLLLRIKEYAERLALRLSRLDRAYGEDFTRHVVWSYWLARTFGDEFAREVTDAHEAGATANTPAEHRQDYANNDIGRRYAVAKKSENQVLQLLKTDPMIVRVAR